VTTLATVRQTVESLLLLLVCVVLATAAGGLRALVTAAALTGASLAGLTVLQEFLIGNTWDFGGLSKVGAGPDLGGATARHSGPLDDPNVWGRNLVLLLPLTLLLSRSGGRRGLLGAGGAAALACGVYLSGSRGALLAAAVALVVWIPLGTARPRRAMLLLALCALAALAVPGVGSRLLTLADAPDAVGGGGDPSLAGRVTVLEHAVAMAVDHPVLGVGAGNFLLADEQYRLQQTTWAGPLQAHNLYLEIVAETGALGALAWALFLGTVIGCGLRTLRAARGGAGTAVEQRSVAAAVLAGLAGWLTASVFLHMNEFRLLLIAVAAAVVADAGRPMARAPEPAAARPVSSRGWWRPAAAAAVAAAALAPVVGVWEVVWRAEAEGRVVPADSSPGVPYVHDVSTRPFLASSYAALAQQVASSGEEGSARATASAHSSVVTVTATGPSAAAAGQGAQRVLASTANLAAVAGAAYVLEPTALVPSIEQDTVVRPTRAAGLLVLCGLSVLVAVRLPQSSPSQSQLPKRSGR
jgi:O-antigen ligase